MRLELTIEQRMNLGNLDGEYNSYQEIFETIVDETSEYDYETFNKGRDEDGNEIIEMQIWRYTGYDYDFRIILNNENDNMRLELTDQQRAKFGNLDGEYDSFEEIFETIIDYSDEYNYETFEMGKDEDGNEIIKMSIWAYVLDDYYFRIILDDEE